MYMSLSLSLYVYIYIYIYMHISKPMKIPLTADARTESLKLQGL